MPKTIIPPPGTGTPIAPFSPGALAEGIVRLASDPERLAQWRHRSDQTLGLMQSEPK